MEINNIYDAAVFQNSINLVCEWAQRWQLKLATTVSICVMDSGELMLVAIL